jgi:hypothetical protein
MKFVYLIISKNSGLIFGCFSTELQALKFIENSTQTFYVQKIEVI